MINPKGRIYKAFKAALDGITYNGITLDVVSYLGKGKTPFYIQMGTITTTDASCKDLFGNECTIDIQVIAQYDGNWASPKDTELIAEDVTNRLNAITTAVIPIDDFDMTYIVLDNGFNDSGQFETERTYRTINQYRFMLFEKVQLGDWILENCFWNDSGIWDDSAFWCDESTSQWILSTGFWRDSGIWVDSSSWID